MRIRLLAVGRSRDAAIGELVRRYAQRCGWPMETVEIQPRGRVDPARQSDIETELLLAAVPAGARVVALDERGRDLDSAGLARILGEWQDEGTREVAFLIGAADGLGEAARQRADLILAFGRMTWPHELVRVLVAEQVYRAWTILSGHPYHRA